MRCDERYRLRIGQQVLPESFPDLCHAELIRVSPCQARPGYRELHFDVEGTPWSWCFPPRSGQGDAPAVPAASRLVLRPGPHGLRAQSVTDQPGHGFCEAEIDLAAAAAFALSAGPVYVHRFLIGRVSPEPGDLAPAQVSHDGVASAGEGR